MSADDEFVRETRENLKRLTNGLVELERRGASREQVDELFRTAHTLKGNCSMAGLDGAARLAHAVEDFLSELRDDAVALEPELMDAALSAVDDIDALLEERNPSDGTLADPESTATTLRERTERHRTDPSESDAEPPADASNADASQSDADSEAEFDSEVQEALASASEFDDLDSLMDGVDTPEDDYESTWGTFEADEERTDADEADATNEPSESETVESSESESKSESESAEFDDIKRTVETDPISNLDQELEDVEFGEFDDDDDLSIQELVEGDLSAGAPPSEAESDAALGASDAPTDESDSEPDADEEGVTPSDAEPTPAASDDASDERPAVGTAREPRKEPAGAEPAIEELTAEEPTPEELTADEPAADRGGDPFGGGVFEADGASAPDGAVDPDADSPPGVDVDELVGEPDDQDDGRADDSGGADLPPDGIDLSEGEGLSEADVASEAFDPSDEGLDSETDFDAPDVELGDDAVDLPEFDALEDADSAPDGSELDVSFDRDEHTVEFESRFAKRFDESDDPEDAAPLVKVAASTIDESNLDNARFQSTGSADGPVDFGAADRGDRIQSISVDVENADTLLNLVEELSLTQLRLKRKAEGDVDEELSSLESLTADLRRSVMELRLMPLSTAIDGLPRVVRDLARKQDKRVAFEVHDEGVHLDRSIVDRIGDPLVHVVRNAVDHGIEPPEERVRKNKPEEGTIELSAWRDRGRVFIEVEDDGRGISAERVRRQAIANDIVTEQEAETMPLDEVYDLVFEPGFTTTDEVTDVSGRGVGMDALRRTVNSLDGTATVRSEPDAGTTVRLSLPVSVAVSDMLFVGIGSERYAVPASTVEGVEPFDESTLVGDDEVGVDWSDDDRPDRLPLVRLEEAFDVPGGARDDERVLVRLHPDTRELALLCDSVDDAREVVVKPYEKLLGAVPGVSGATMSGDGTLVNIIDVATL